MSEKEELYEKIKAIVLTDDSGLLLASNEIAALIDEGENSWHVLLFAMVAVRACKMEAQADDYAQKAENLKNNAGMLEFLITQ